MFINAFDMARFGYLISAQWKMERNDDRFREMDQHGADSGPWRITNYGFANWFLNTDRKPFPAAPLTVGLFEGNGDNIIYID